MYSGYHPDWAMANWWQVTTASTEYITLPRINHTTGRFETREYSTRQESINRLQNINKRLQSDTPLRMFWPDMESLSHAVKIEAILQLNKGNHKRLSLERSDKKDCQPCWWRDWCTFVLNQKYIYKSYRETLDIYRYIYSNTITTTYAHPYLWRGKDPFEMFRRIPLDPVNNHSALVAVSEDSRLMSRCVCFDVCS